jgi:sirohydrochlorin ferrochelatase
VNVLLAHGSSDSRHADDAERLAKKASEELGEAIELRFLNSESMPDGSRVLPMLLGEGWHAKVDLKRLAEASSCTMLPSLSARAVPIACMAGDLAKQALAGDGSAIFAVYHLEGFETITRSLAGLAARFERLTVVEMHKSPNVAEALAGWLAEGVENMVVQPMALFEGKTMESVRRTVEQSATGALVGAALSTHIAFPSFIADCFRAASGELNAA